MDRFENYKAEAEKRWGETDAYKEHAKKTKDYSKDKWNGLLEEMNGIFAGFARCMEEGKGPDSPEAQRLVLALQSHITNNYYNCTKEILSGLGKMYVLDERFKENIDKNAKGTALFASNAIEIYCKS